MPCDRAASKVDLHGRMGKSWLHKVVRRQAAQPHMTLVVPLHLLTVVGYTQGGFADVVRVHSCPEG